MKNSVKQSSPPPVSTSPGTDCEYEKTNIVKPATYQKGRTEMLDKGQSPLNPNKYGPDNSLLPVGNETDPK